MNSKSIKLAEGFSLVYEEERQNNKPTSKINILKLNLKFSLIAIGWMEVTDFVAILECATRNKLGTKNKYSMNDIVIYGVMEEEFMVYIEGKHFTDTYKYNIVHVQKIISKLNKLLHMADKLHGAIEISSLGY